MSGCYRNLGNYLRWRLLLGAVSGFGWRSWANLVALSPCPLCTVPKPTVFSPW